ncbi:MAG: succinate--CoA ligase subunit beta [Acidobacteria bacterium RIFCSPHIGHO2_01_FULL_67_28]|nr:MAG: succinate--CoA ligase subunit beta [Acidobacteria bacterium RIFCSPHIGHO2_01_FULL_67_28]
MKIHEYQAKQIFARYGVPIPRGEVASTPQESAAVAARLAAEVVVKAQIHAGGRGKGGGIRKAATPADAEKHAAAMLGRPLVTPQTGPQGRVVRRVLVEETLPIERELYLGLVIDRALARVVVMASAAGGMEIEEVARENPEAILKAALDPATGLPAFQTRRLAFGLDLKDELGKQAAKLLAALYRVFVEQDASLVEVNPCIVTRDGRLVALDAKINFDDNALFRHPELAALRDLNEEEPLEIEASKHSLNYIKLDGNVGCMVNGAGLAMSTMDIIQLAGGQPANFLDVGGGASAEQIREAFKILVADKSVRAVLINIFGGILRCDRLATGVVEAARQLHLTVPIVVRMEGTNVKQGREILRKSGLNFTVAADMKDAAEKVVARAKKQ